VRLKSIINYRVSASCIIRLCFVWSFNSMLGTRMSELTIEFKLHCQKTSWALQNCFLHGKVNILEKKTNDCLMKQSEKLNSDRFLYLELIFYIILKYVRWWIMIPYERSYWVILFYVSFSTLQRFKKRAYRKSHIDKPSEC